VRVEGAGGGQGVWVSMHLHASTHFGRVLTREKAHAQSETHLLLPEYVLQIISPGVQAACARHKAEGQGHGGCRG
jgi:hypothetical protein